MSLRGIVLGLAMFFQWTAFAEATLTKTQKLEALRRALRGSRAPEVSQEATTAEPNFRERALSELKVDESQASETPRPLATVRTQSLVVVDPRRYEGLEFGLALSQMQPRGRVPIVSLGERDLAEVPPLWVAGAELRYRLASGWGARGFVHYGQSQVSWLAPTGRAFENTKLHLLHTGVLVGRVWSSPRIKGWGFATEAGLGRWDLIQTGNSELTESSDTRWLMQSRIGPVWMLDRLSLWAALEWRRPLVSGWSQVPQSAVLAGVQYGLR